MLELGWLVGFVFEGWIRNVGRMDDLLGYAGGADENVYFAKVVDDILNCIENRTCIPHVDLVEAHVDPGLGRELSGCFVTELLLDVHDRDALNSNLCKRLCHVQAESTATTAEVDVSDMKALVT